MKRSSEHHGATPMNSLPPVPTTRVLGLALWLSPLTVLAHVEGDAAGGFLSGFSHPISGLDHVLAMVAVGLWGAQLGAPAIWLLPVAFPIMMAFGGLLGLSGVELPAVELGIALSAVILGALILGAIVGLFAVFHGHAHGTEMTPGQSAILYSIGFVIATGLLHAVGIGIGLIERWHLGPWDAGRLALRGTGSIVMAGGLFFLWSALA
jgi:urease accessory protein